MQHGCWQCHGTMGQGSIATSGGKRLAPDPLPWEAFSGFVRSTNRAMPPYSEKFFPMAISLTSTPICSRSRSRRT